MGIGLRRQILTSKANPHTGKVNNEFATHRLYNNGLFYIIEMIDLCNAILYIWADEIKSN